MNGLNSSKVSKNGFFTSTVNKASNRFQVDNSDSMNDDELRQWRWNNLIKKISFDPPFEDYYLDFEIKPGFWFWQLLAIHPKTLKKLNVRIPHSLVVLGNNNFTWLSYNPKLGGIVRKTELNITLADFEKTLINEVDSRYTKEDFYLLVQRTPGRVENEVSKTVFTNHGWKSKRAMGSNLDYPALMQQYVYPKSTSATITRVCYKTHNYKGTKASFGFNICNKTQIHSDDFKIPISRKSTLCKDIEDSFDVRHLSGVVLKDFELYCGRLVDFLESGYHVRITEIVCDFITDGDNKKYLFNVKSVRIHQISKKLEYKLKMTKKTFNELTCTIYCKLCGLIFKKDDASKILTYKLLWEFCQHSRTRGVNLKDIDFTHNSTRPCRVCNLCYKVVVAEHELIELEQKFALAQNIPIKDLYLKVSAKKVPKNRPALLKEQLQKWRLLIYLTELQIKSSQEDLIQRLKDPFYIQLKISSIKSKFLIKLPPIKGNQSYINFPINILRLFYFFSENMDISKFLEGTRIDIRLTRTEDWNDLICHGSTNTINGFKNNTNKGQKHESVIYLFFEDDQMIALKTYLGLVCDGHHNTAFMNLYEYNGIYFPDNDFYSCNIFPPEWIELLTDTNKNMNIRASKYKNFVSRDDYNTASLQSANELSRMLEEKDYTKKKFKLNEFRNMSNLFVKEKTTKRTEPETAHPDRRRLFSALPTNIETNKDRKKSSFVIKKVKHSVKAFSPSNSRNFTSRIDNIFSSKMEEEDYLYKDYLINVNMQHENEDTNKLIDKYAKFN